MFGPYFDDTRPLAAHPTIRPAHAYTQTSMKMSEFLQRISISDTDTNTNTDGVVGNDDKDATATTKANYTYLTREIERIHPSLENDLQPIHDLIILGPQFSSINLWMGQKNVLAPCHYDGYHNIYVQIRGRKTFYMVPPTAHALLKPFPFLHPSHAQCQRRLINHSYTSHHMRNKMNKDLDVYVATLKPGDVLYIPPLWFHEVVAEEQSISVNGWTPSKESDVVERLFAVKLPISWSRAQREEDKLAVLSAMLIDFVPVLFVLYNERFATLIEQDILPGSTMTREEEVKHVLGGCDDVAAVWSSKKDDVIEWKENVMKILKEMNVKTKDIWFGNFIESLLFTIVGTEKSELVGARLKDVMRCANAMNIDRRNREL